MRRHRAQLLLLAPVMLLTACSSSSTSAATTGQPLPTTAAPTTVVKVSITVATTVPSTPSSTALTTTTTLPIVLSFPDQETAAQKLFSAWKSGDQNAALGLGPAGDLAKLFTSFRPQSNAEDRHCDNGEFGTSSCFFANGQGGVNVTVTHNTDGSWSITKVDAY